jgi:hypothetical protein
VEGRSIYQEGTLLPIGNNKYEKTKLYHQTSKSLRQAELIDTGTDKKAISVAINAASSKRATMWAALFPPTDEERPKQGLSQGTATAATSRLDRPVA